MMKKGSGWFLKILAYLVFAASAEAMPVPYVFTNIADSTGPLNEFIYMDNVAINDAGTVGFWASFDDGGAGIFTGRGGPLTPVADTLNQFSLLSPYIDINNPGMVAFSATLRSGGRGLFVNSAGVNTKLYEGSYGSPSINDAGVLAFRDVDHIYRGDGGPLTLIADTTGPFFILSDPAINAAGTVAFATVLDGAGNSILTNWYTGSGGSLTLIADASGPIRGTTPGNSPAITDVGTVVFSPQLDSFESAIFAGNGGPLNVVVDSTGEFAGFFRVAVNNAGAIAFEGGLDTGEPGIFGGGGPFDRIILKGDPLFGSTVKGVVMYHDSLNDAGQVAFIYILADGRQGVARAEPVPEPSTLLLIGSGLVGVIGFGRKKLFKKA